MLFFVEITDMFGGEANFAWVTRHKISAKSIRGAVQKIARRSGLHWRFDGIKWVSESGATCMFVEEFDDEQHPQYRFDTEDSA